MGSGKCSISADFIEHSGRKLFSILLRPPGGDQRGSILFLPPFAEEMHKARHIVASQARELAGAGYNVLLLDLYGCGDSGGDFADANWSLWLQDAAFGIDTLRTLNTAPVFIWGLRMGALLGCQLAQGRDDIRELMLWQPTLNGEQQIDQFLRIGSVPSTTDNREFFNRKSMWNELRSGRSLEIAGYELSAELALEMARARLSGAPPECPVAWFNVGGQGLSVASENVVNNWRQQGVEIEVRDVAGDPFWRITEAPINRELQRSTTEWMLR